MLRGWRAWSTARLADFLSFETLFVTLFFFTFLGDAPLAQALGGLGLYASLAASIAGAGLLLLRGKLRQDRDAGMLLLIMVSLMCWALLSTLWSPSVQYANISLMRLIGLSGWCFVAGLYIISADVQRQRRFFAGLALIGCYLAFEAARFYAAALASGEFASFVTALDLNYLGLARAVGFAALITLYYALYECWAWPWRAACALAAAVLFLLMLIIGARTALVATVLCAGILILPRIRLRLSPRGLLRGLLLTICICGSIWLGLRFLPGGAQVTDAFLSIRRILFLLDYGFQSNDRYIRYVTTWQGLERSPVIGNGIGSWSVLNGYGDVLDYPHNLWLDLLFELGLPGLLLMLLLLWWGLRRYWPVAAWRDVPYAPLALALFMSCFISAQFSGNYSDHWHMYALLGVMLLVPLARPGAPPAAVKAVPGGPSPPRG